VFRAGTLTDQARPANLSALRDTFTFSPSLMKSGTRISIPVSSFGWLCSAATRGSPAHQVPLSDVQLHEHRSSNPIGFPLYFRN